VPRPGSSFSFWEIGCKSLKCTVGIEAIGFLEQEARQQRDDQRRTQRVEGIAEGEVNYFSKPGYRVI
jgi:hypothetical protein